MTAVTMDTYHNFSNGTTYVRTAFSASFVFTVVKNLGLCVEVTNYLAWVLQVNAIVQTVISLPGILGAAFSLRVTCLRRNRSSLSVQVSLNVFV